MRVCFHCSQVRESMNGCLGSRKVSYCSRDCQKANWQQHKNLCQAKRGSVLLHQDESGEKPFDIFVYFADFIQVRHQSQPARAAGVAKRVKQILRHLSGGIVCVTEANHATFLTTCTDRCS